MMKIIFQQTLLHLEKNGEVLVKGHKFSPKLNVVWLPNVLHGDYSYSKFVREYISGVFVTYIHTHTQTHTGNCVK